MTAMHVQPTSTVLVVEDEPLVRLTAAGMVEEAGWIVLEAGNSAEALRTLSDHPEVAVLFTDITMPGDMDGLALAEAVHRLRPDIELVITSGKMTVANDNLPDDGTFLRKPYRFDDLANLIRGKLEKAG